MMEGWTMLLLLANAAGAVFFGRAVLFKEPQYTGWSWFALGMATLNCFNVVMILTNA